MIRDGTAVGPRHHSRLLALIPGVVDASASRRMAARATSTQRAGVVTSARKGHTIRTMAGMELPD